MNGGIIMKLVPLSDRVVLKQCEAEETTKSGIILTSSAQEKPQEAEVIAVGPGGVVDGKEVVMQVKVGDKVKHYKGDAVLVATGASENMVNFEGWTKPGVIDLKNLKNMNITPTTRPKFSGFTLPVTMLLIYYILMD